MPKTNRQHYIAPAFYIVNGVYVTVRFHVCEAYVMTVCKFNTFKFPNINVAAMGTHYIAAAKTLDGN